MPHCIILCGMPASGKSTWRNEITLKGYEVLSTDDLIEEYARSIGKTYDEVFTAYISVAEDRFWSSLELAVTEKRNIIVDRTNINQKARRRILARLTKDYTKTAVAFIPPDRQSDYDEHMRRLDNRPGKTIPKHVLLSMQANFQVPTEEEGFDVVQLFNIWGDDYYSYI
ncbi:MAG: ATP-binding protein [Candidatus Microsaccharimonas sp.]